MHLYHQLELSDFFHQKLHENLQNKGLHFDEQEISKEKEKEKENNNPFQLQFKTSRTSQFSLMIKTCPRAPHSKYHKLNNITLEFAIRMMALQPMEFCSF